MSAINAALEQALFSLTLGDHRWAVEIMDGWREPYIYGFTLPCGLAARAQITVIGHDELSFVAWVLLPPGYAKVHGYLQHDGIAWARGWLERRRGIYLQNPLAVPEPEEADLTARPGGGTAARLRRSRPARPMTVMTLAELDDWLERWRWDERGPSHIILAHAAPAGRPSARPRSRQPDGPFARLGAASLALWRPPRQHSGPSRPIEDTGRSGAWLS